MILFTYINKGDLAAPHGAYAYEYLKKCIPFKEEYYDFSGNKLDKFIDRMIEDKYNGTFFMEFHYYQLGKSDKWYRDKITSLGNLVRARREYGLEWINTNGNSPFDPDDINLLQEMSAEKAKTVREVKFMKHYAMRMYEDYRGARPVIISVDVALGQGQDSSAIVAINPDTLKPIAVFKSNMIDTRRLKKIIVKIGTKIFPNCIITVENNSLGTGLLAELKHTAVRSKLYREQVKKKKDMGVNSFTKKKTYNTIEFGHNTNSTSRPRMMEMLEELVKNHKSHVCMPEIYQELRFLERRNGTIRHSSASHDDVTMAYLGGLYIIRYGTGLKGTGIYYEIDSEPDDDELKALEKIALRTQRAQRTLDKFIGDDNPDEEWLDEMTTPRPVLTSHHIMELERQELIDLDCKMNGIPDEEGNFQKKTNVSKKSQNLILGNTSLAKKNHHFLSKDEDEDDQVGYGTISIWND